MKKETLELAITQHMIKTFPCPTVGRYYKIRLLDLQDWDLFQTVKLVKDDNSFEHRPKGVASLT